MSIFDIIKGGGSFTRQNITNLNDNFALITSGTYTPTLTAVHNISAMTAYPSQYLKVGHVVTVSMKVSATVTLDATLTTYTITVPVDSAFTQVYQAGGSALSYFNSTINGAPGTVLAVPSSSTVTVNFIATYTGDTSMYVHFTYRVIES